MKKDVIDVTLTTYELTALLRKILDHKVFTFYYKNENNYSLGVSYFINIESVNYDDKAQELIFKGDNNYLKILIPENLTNDIQCVIIHKVTELVDYEKLTEIEEKEFLYGQLDEDKIQHKKKRHDFEISIDKFHIFIDDLDYSIFYNIIANLDELTDEYIDYLERKEMDSRVEIDLFWDSIDNAMEK